MWTRMLFWRRKANKIYTVCPEIRHLLDVEARRDIRNAIRMTLLLPLHLITFALAFLAWLYEAWGRLVYPIVDWARERDRDIV